MADGMVDGIRRVGSATLIATMPTASADVRRSRGARFALGAAR